MHLRVGDQCDTICHLKYLRHRHDTKVKFSRQTSHCARKYISSFLGHESIFVRVVFTKEKKYFPCCGLARPGPTVKRTWIMAARPSTDRRFLQRRRFHGAASAMVHDASARHDDAGPAAAARKGPRATALTGRQKPPPLLLVVFGGRRSRIEPNRRHPRGAGGACTNERAHGASPGPSCRRSR